MKSNDRIYGWQVQDRHERNKFDLDTTKENDNDNDT